MANILTYRSDTEADFNSSFHFIQLKHFVTVQQWKQNALTFTYITAMQCRLEEETPSRENKIH